MQVFTGHNSDSYTGQGKIWQIAKRFNDESRKHIFDRHGNKLTKEVLNKHYELEVVAQYPREEMLNRQCMKRETLNVSRRKVSKDEYEPVGVL
jgi:hypothetical protein